MDRTDVDREYDTVGHVAINVANLEQAVHWYTTSFSCEVISRSPKRVILQFANVRVSLVLPSLEPPHIAFCKSDAASFGELTDRGDGAPSTLLSDPTGNIVKLFSTD